MPVRHPFSRSKREDDIVGDGWQGNMVVSVGGNDIRVEGGMGTEELLRRFKDMIKKVKAQCGRMVVCGILPRIYMGKWWNSCAMGVNHRLDSFCQDNDVTFLDTWDSFIHQQWLYARDGIHLTRRGQENLSERINEILGFGR